MNNEQPTSARKEVHNNGNRYEQYQPNPAYYRPREERTEELQPQEVKTTKHWYDEYPIEDRRKQLQESVQRRNFRKSQENAFQEPAFDRAQSYDRYAQPSHEGYEHTRDRSSDHAEQRFDFGKSGGFDKNDFNENNDRKYFSRSYNRNGNNNKRTFVKPALEQDEPRFGSLTPNDHRNMGKSASHGIGRNFQNYAQPTFNPSYGAEVTNRCDIKFNTKSVNYDMTEIELPAYCKKHPDNKLLYIITPHGAEGESELGCVNCAHEATQKKDQYTVVEVKQKLGEYINHTSELLRNKPRAHNQQKDEIINKIGICKDREVAMIRQYYDKMMEALAYERDRHISQITQVAEDNIQQLSRGTYHVNGHKQNKNDIKLKNFGIELGKVLDGVEETGIHIKELWKINQDYNDVIRNKLNECRGGQFSSHQQPLNSFEFHIADENRLRELAQRAGQVITKQVGLEYFIHDEYDNNSRRSSSKPIENNSTYGRYQNEKSDYVPTFGMLNRNDETTTPPNGQQFSQNEEYDTKFSHHTAHFQSNVETPAQPQQPSKSSQQQDYLYESKYEPYDGSKYQYANHIQSEPDLTKPDSARKEGVTGNNYTPKSGYSYSKYDKYTKYDQVNPDEKYEESSEFKSYQKYAKYTANEGEGTTYPSYNGCDRTTPAAHSETRNGSVPQRSSMSCFNF